MSTSNSIIESGLVQRDAKYVASERSTSYYASSIQMVVSFFDFKIKHGEFIRFEGNEAIFEERVTIILSPQHAKAFLRALSENVSRYEELFGTIPDAPKHEPPKQ